jgi:hypothetical protein
LLDSFFILALRGFAFYQGVGVSRADSLLVEEEEEDISTLPGVVGDIILRGHHIVAI